MLVFPCPAYVAALLVLFNRAALLVRSDVSLYSTWDAYRSSGMSDGVSPKSPHQSGPTPFTRTGGEVTMRSGLPRNHRSAASKATGGGRSAGLPSGAPLSAHFAM